jgi:hypothetical protein
MELKTFVDRWFGREGGAERANYALFLSEFCQTFDLPPPDPSGHGLGDYEFEAPVKSEAVYGGKGTKRIDLYKRNCFILEAKQSQVKPGEVIPADAPQEALETVTDLFGNIIGHTASTTKKAPRYDRLMADARVQAERYALALPDNHKTPPFLIVADIGRSFELYFDWAGNGRGYSFFPDQQNYRITLDQLHDEKIRDLLRGIWTNPASVDPRLKSAEVTREIAKQLSLVAGHLEETQRLLNPGKGDDAVSLGIESTSLFLMRLLFCMFAEDVELLPEGSFTAFLDEAREKSDIWWRRGLSDLWHQMSKADLPERFWSFGDAEIRYFNGNLFSSSQVYDLDKPFKGTLYTAAKQDWRSVEPAIFGTLLEQVLTTAERAKLGAHYTPRPYVQRLVSATFGDLLNDEWAAVEEGVRNLISPSPLGEGEGVGPVRPEPISKLRKTDKPHPNPSPEGEGLKRIQSFHTRLCNLRILDPACGTGNFLYVSMEELLRLEGKVIALAESLGTTITPAVHPNQFLGLELNPRAAVIAELVLWIGWLRHRLANHPTAIGDPVLPTLTNINGGTHGGFDAVLSRTATGEPDTANPMVPDWPIADFIVGNPPFIAGQDLRKELGDDYAEALWKANPRVQGSADYVMQWWDRAAHILTAKNSPLQRFGFVTTNSITQTFSRRVIEGYLFKASPLVGEVGGGRAASAAQKSQTSNATATIPSDADASGPHPNPPHRGEGTLSLILAIPDHPWTKATKDAAAVRIAMTVAQAGAHDGRFLEVLSEGDLTTENPEIICKETVSRINADLSIGADVTSARKLTSNAGICHDGVKLHGKGFSIKRNQAEALGLGRREGLEAFIRPYRNGKDLAGRTESEVRDKMVIDLFGEDEKAFRKKFPELYQYVLASVKPERDKNSRQSYKDLWWIFGEPRREMRPALENLPCYIGTVDTAKHRVFQYLPAEMLCDDGVVVIASASSFDLGILNSNQHVQWAKSNCSALGLTERYPKTVCFDPFPFPDATPEQRAAISELAEELDATRKAALAEVPGLTMTEIYNLVAWLKSQNNSSPPAGEGEKADRITLDRATLDRASDARAGIVLRLHEQIDAAVADAYGWGEAYKRGGLNPSEIVTRLVALNAERAAEEAQGKIRWLRPDYQIAKFAPKK